MSKNMSQPQRSGMQPFVTHANIKTVTNPGEIRNSRWFGAPVSAPVRIKIPQNVLTAALEKIRRNAINPTMLVPTTIPVKFMTVSNMGLFRELETVFVPYERGIFDLPQRVCISSSCKIQVGLNKVLVPMTDKKFLCGRIILGEGVYYDGIFDFNAYGNSQVIFPRSFGCFVFLNQDCKVNVIADKDGFSSIENMVWSNGAILTLNKKLQQQQQDNLELDWQKIINTEQFMAIRNEGEFTFPDIPDISRQMILIGQKENNIAEGVKINGITYFHLSPQGVEICVFQGNTQIRVRDDIIELTDPIAEVLRAIKGGVKYYSKGVFQGRDCQGVVQYKLWHGVGAIKLDSISGAPYFYGEVRGGAPYGSGVFWYMFYERCTHLYEGVVTADGMDGPGEMKLMNTNLTFTGVWEHNVLKEIKEVKLANGIKVSGKVKIPEFWSYDFNNILVEDAELTLSDDNTYRGGCKIIRRADLSFDVVQHGYGLMNVRVPNGEIRKSVGFWENGEFVGGGVGLIKDKLGNEYFGEVSANGVRHGEGTMWFKDEGKISSAYTGRFENGYRVDGFGALIEYSTDDGKIKEFKSEGFWVEKRLREGRGLINFDDGEYYYGDVKDFKPHGEGYKIVKNSNDEICRSSGVWEKGEFIFGKVYVGKLSLGELPDGKGIMTQKNPECRIEGVWKHGGLIEVTKIDFVNPGGELEKNITYFAENCGNPRKIEPVPNKKGCFILGDGVGIIGASLEKMFRGEFVLLIEDGVLKDISLGRGIEAKEGYKSESATREGIEIETKMA